MQDPEFVAGLQKIADADHARQSTCSWCRKPGTPFEHNGVRFDGLVACSGDRLCSRCSDSYLENTPLLVLEFNYIGADDRVHWMEYDLNRKTRLHGEEGTGFTGRHVITAGMDAREVVEVRDVSQYS